MKGKVLVVAIFAAAAMLRFSALARAAGGVIEINQAVVNAAGGFPYKISMAGSYRLSGNLIVSGVADGIDVTIGDVTIDLNGFTISGPSVGTGISSGSNNEVGVENGIVIGFGTGVALSASSIVKGVRADSNKGAGIVVSNNSTVEGCTANSNGAVGGIQCDGSNCAISGNTANSNGTPGVGGNGIECIGSNCTISGNTANSNGGSGIECVTEGCVISGNTANSQTTGSGIFCKGSGCLITGNTALNNLIDGIAATDATTGYGGNVLNGNGTNASGGTSLWPQSLQRLSLLRIRRGIQMESAGDCTVVLSPTYQVP
jgi:parallel beta-helix repeat protein